ncbi:hypothetical protein VB716_03070 [Synechococcus sp. CCY9201]|nr:hypothetical protein [Synechococcus sp. CCY9201]MEA5473198.1 hypothetical protein [Synechococcus sp. CCY9201]
MRDEQGRLWLMSGHHSFELVEKGGDGNRISVSSVRSQPAAAVDHTAHSMVKLNGHGQNTVTLYAQPSFGAAIAGMGESGVTLDKLSCTSNSQGTWCRVGYPGQNGRVLWVHGDALVYLGDGECPRPDRRCRRDDDPPSRGERLPLAAERGAPPRSADAGDGGQRQRKVESLPGPEPDRVRGPRRDGGGPGPGGRPAGGAVGRP